MSAVIVFSPRTQKVRNRPLSRCDHKYIEVDTETRIVECANCHKKVDPIWWLERFAQELAAEQEVGR